ncbi:MAG TPA: carboxypeptidase-like regulatory domain-containing protein [Kofleriaceae bacterium]|nr:carboxypeptidase-like regulatory domain-containing protein [Kofleriaceae bacterium]
MRKIVIAILLVATTARAQSAKKSAELLFEDGKRLLAAGNTAEACPKFEQSQKLDPAIGTLLNLAHCYEVAGRVSSAWTTYLDAETLAKAKKDKRAKAAHDLAAGLAAKVPKLIVRATGAPAGAAITIAGAPLEASLVGAPVPVDPGSITIEATAEGYTPFTQTITLAAGATATVDVVLAKAKGEEPKPPPKIETPPPKIDTPPPEKFDEPYVPPQEPTAKGHRVLGWSLGAGGVVAIGGATAFALVARSDYNGAFDTGACDKATRRCTPIGYRITNDARRDANIAGGVAAAGVVALAAGVYFLVTAPSDDDTDSSKASAYLVPAVGSDGVGLVFGGSL